MALDLKLRKFMILSNSVRKKEVVEEENYSEKFV